MQTKLPAGCFLVALVFLFSAAAPLLAQTERGGLLVGRVFNATSGVYLSNAKITLPGANRETFTDEGGYFRLENVRAGEMAVAAFFTGLERQTATVKVTPGQTTRQDFELTVGKAGPVVELGKFVVAANREFNAQAIATNEQRFAADMRNVVSADEYGDIGEGNMGEFLKQVPGVDVEYAGGVVARTASVRGFPPESTILTMDGGDVANVGYSALSRAANLDLLTMNNVARVEIFKSPTPDKPANMLGGAINVVTRTAFEQKSAKLNYRAFGTVNSKHIGQGTRPGPGYEGEMNPLQPGFDVSYILPVTANFGVTAAATYFARHNESDLYQGTWNHAAPAAPILTGSVRNTSPQIRSGGSVGGGFDWRLSDRNVLGGAFSYTEKYAAADGRILTSALGAGAVGDARSSQSLGARGSVTMTASGADRYDRSTHGSLKFRHTGPIWRINSNGFYSYSTSMGRAGDKGKFSALSANIANLDMSLNGVGTAQSPFNTTITARTATGAPVDVYDSRNYTLNTVGSTQRDATGIKTGLNVDVDRSFNVGFPLQVTAGYALRRSDYDQKSPNVTWTFLGPDGIAGNADNRVGLYDIQNQSYSRIGQHFGTPKTQWIDPYKLWNLFQSNPRYFREDPATTIQTAATQRRKFTETIHAGYLRGDARFIDSRLLIVGGVRFEQTLNEGAGLLNDIRATLRQDANGNLLRDASGRTIPVTTDPVELARLRYKTLAGKAEGSYSGYYPSLNLRYNLSEPWIARASYAKSIGRPALGSILPGTTITDPDVANPTITVSNPELKPWTADSFEVSLETYYGGNGMASISAYRKQLTGFFASVRSDATEELLREYFLPLDYLNYDIVTQTNIDSGVRIDGLELSARQPLNFLPNWARGLQVNASVTLKKLSGPSAATLQDFGGSTANWGVSLNRTRYAVRLNWNHRAEFRTGVPSSDIADYRAKETLLDLSTEVRLWKRFGAYFSARNLLNAPNQIDRHGPQTPGYARIRQFQNTGVFMTFGIKGEF